MKQTSIFLVLLLISASNLIAQNNVIVDSNLWQPNGTVYKTHTKGDTLIIGGDFTLVGKNTPFAATFNNSGKLLDTFPNTNGEVKKAISDGRNGFYIAGDFSKVGGKIRGGLAHINSSGKVTDFFKNQAINGYINDLELKDSSLYIGGNFISINEYTGGGAITNYDTNTVNFNFPKIEGDVYTSEPDGEGGIYIGGKFTKVGEFYRENIAHIDKFGRVTAWNPKANSEVFAIACNKTRVFVGGNFSYIGCEKRHIFASFKKGENSPDTLQFTSQQINPNVYALEIYGGKLYIGTGVNLFSGSGPSVLLTVNINNNTLVRRQDGYSDIQAIKGVGRHVYVGGDGHNLYPNKKLFEIDTTTGVLRGSIVDNFDNGSVYALESIGDTILIIGGSPTSGVPKFFGKDVRTTKNTYFTFGGIYPDEWVTSLAIINDSTIIRISRGSLGKISITSFGINSRKALLWQQRQSVDFVRTISVLDSNTLFLGGEFKTIEGKKRTHITSINTATSQVSNWNYTLNYEVYDVEVADTSIYIAGQFSKINNLQQPFLAQLHPNSNSIGSWNPNPNWYVQAMKLKGDTIFLGGTFTGISGTSTSHFAVLNRHSASVYPFVNVTGGIHDFILEGSSLYILGQSTLTVNSTPKNYIALVNANNGALQSFSSNLAFSPNSIALWDNKIVCRGSFSSFFDNPKRYIEILDATTGTRTGQEIWTSGLVNTLTTTSDNKLFIGGRFMLGNAKVRKNLAMINLTTGEALDWSPPTNKTVRDFEVIDGKVYITGDFTEVNGKTRNYIAATYLATDSLLNWNPNLNSNGFALEFNNGRMFTIGNFTTVNSQTRNRFAAIDTGTGQPTIANPFASSTGVIVLTSLESYNSDVYVGGTFTNIGGQNRNYVASINSFSGAVNSFDAKLNSSPSFLPRALIKRADSTLYISGDFQQSGTINTKGFLRLNAQTQIIDSWVPNTNNPISVINQDNSKLYFGFSQSKINDKCRCNISIIDTSSKKLSPWHPDFDKSLGSLFSISPMAFSNNKTYIGGNFNRVNHKINNYLIGIRQEAIDLEQPSNKDFCLGGEMRIPLITSGSFDTSNRFILVISDTLGNFVNPIYIDTIAAPTDTFFYKIPKTLTVKNDYRLKVISTYPNLQGREEVFINILPEPKANFTINDPYQCLYKNTFIFTNTSNIPGDVAWSFGDSSTGKRQTDFHAYKATGIYDAQMVLKPYGNGCPNDTIIKQAEILPQPIPSFIVNDTLQCNHIDSFVFTNTSTISRGSMTYLWKLDSAKTSLDSNTFNSYISTGIRTITLTTTSDSGCIDSIKKDIEVIDKPIVSFSISSTSQCLKGNSFDFTNTSPSSPYFSSKWYLGEGDTSTSQSVIKSFTKDSTFFVKLVVTKDSACGDSTLKSVVVNPNPVVSFSVDSTTKCQNDTFSFSSTTSINSGFVQGLSWDLGDGTISSDTSVAHNYSDSGNYTVTLIAASDSGCFDTANKKVVALAIPTTNFQINDSLQCFKTQFFQFTDLSIASGSDSIVSYNWDLGDTTFTTLKNPTHTYSDTGYYIVTLKTISSLGCSDTTRLIAAVAPEPQIDTIFGKTLVTGLDTNTYTITNDTFTTYFWSVDYGTLLLGPDSSSSQIIWDSVASTTNTAIKIFPINIAGCFGDTAYLSIQIDPFLNSVFNVSYKQLKVFPNPAKKAIFISLTNDNIKQGKVQLFDITGKEVLTKTYTNISTKDIEVDISKLEAGTYLIQFSSSNFKASAKILIITD